MRCQRRSFGNSPRGARIHLGDDGVSIVQPDGVHRTARWSDVQGVGLDPDGVHHVQSVDGACVPIRAADWRGGNEIIKVLKRQVPTELFFRADSDDEDTSAER